MLTTNFFKKAFNLKISLLVCLLGISACQHETTNPTHSTSEADPMVSPQIREIINSVASDVSGQNLSEGELLYRQSVALTKAKKYEEGFLTLEKAAKTNHVQSQLMLALSYERGIGTSINYLKAKEWHEKAAEQGNSTAQYFVGFYYLFGYGGTDRNYDKGINWLKKSAQQGDKSAQEVLNTCFFKR